MQGNAGFRDVMHAAAMLQKTQASPRVCWHLFCRSLRSFQMSNRQLLAGHTMPRTPHVDEHHSFMCFAGISEGLQNAKDRMHVLQLVLQLFVSLQRVLWQLPESCNRLLRKHFRSSTAGALCFRSPDALSETPGQGCKYSWGGGSELAIKFSAGPRIF